MPLLNLHKRNDGAWALWRIEEDERSLTHQLNNAEPVPTAIRNPIKRLEFLAGRALARKLAEGMGQVFNGVGKDAYGKPHLKGSGLRISLSHSYPYAAAVVDWNNDPGIDVEQPKQKLFTIASRVLSAEEQHDAGVDLLKHCIYWCAKECLIKVHGKTDLVLAENLRIDPFRRENQGDLIGRLLVDTTRNEIPLQYYDYENFVVVVSR